ncbi:MAG: hypothetical protein K2P59_10880 [Acetatifactor sp.]|nr:hypothetical protein [Acetatifactor sp.]
MEGKAFYIDSPRVVDEFSVLGLMDDDAARARIEEMLVPYRTIQRRVVVRGFSGSGRYLVFDDFQGASLGEDKAEPESNVEMQEMDEIIRRFNDELIKIMHGTLKFGQSHEQLEYSDPDYADSFTLRNLSTGAKAVSLLQCILHYRVLRKKEAHCSVLWKVTEPRQTFGKTLRIELNELSGKNWQEDQGGRFNP